jgi:hypothetical protein
LLRVKIAIEAADAPMPAHERRLNGRLEWTSHERIHIAHRRR